MLAKINRLKKRTEFAYSYKKGKPIYNNNLTLVVFKRTDKLLRIGFSVSKKVGKAVVRNKVKRQLRAIVYDLVKFDKISKGYNLIFIAKENLKDLSYVKMQESVINILQKSKI